MMKLTWRDAAATVPVAAAAALYWAFRSGAELPLMSGPRVLAVVLFVLGLGACIAGGIGVPADTGSAAETTWRKVFGVHGALAFVLALLVVITGSTGLLAALAALIVLLWLVTTVRHLAGTLLAGHAAEAPAPVDRHPVSAASGPEAR